MATVQSSYPETMRDGVAGQIATASPCIIDSYVVAASETSGIDFGYGVKAASTLGECEAGADPGTGGLTPFDVTNFLGVAVKSPGVGSTETTDDNQYNASDHASVLSQGDVWVPVAAAVTAGGTVVTMDPATGQFGATAAGATRPRVNGIWRTSTTGAGLAVLRLFGTIA